MSKITTCIDCGKAITYDRKAPDRCPECREKFQYKKSKIPATRSKLEFTIQGWLDELFPEPACHYIVGGYYSWLRSPKNQPLQLDALVYVKGRMLFAIEVEGKQHYQKLFWQTDDDFDYLRDCDILKARTMAAIGVPLIKMKAEEEYTKDDFVSILYKNGIKPYAIASDASSTSTIG